MGIASLVLGIIALILSFFGVFGWLSAILGIVGIILGAVGRKDASKRGVATAGLVLSIIAVAWGLIMWSACAAFVASL